MAPSNPPDIEMHDEYGVLHQVWKISDPSLIDLVRGKMRDKKLIIADGHHRYETALNYRNERRTPSSSSSVSGVPREHSGDNPLVRPIGAELAPYELSMMTFVNMDS